MRLLGLLLLAGSSVFGADEPARFSVSFDRDFDGTDSAGAVPGRYSVEVLFENLGTYLREGLVGKAVLVGTGDGSEACHLTFPNRDYIRPDRGTVSFWVSPMDWDGKDAGRFHVFFRAAGANANLMVYRYFQGSDLLFLMGLPNGPTGKEANTCARCDVRHWRRGEWHHVAATWGGGSMRLYADGALAHQIEPKPDARVKNPFDRLGVGGLGDWKTPQDHSLVDELRLYDRMLSGDEVLALFRAQEPRAAVLNEKATSGRIEDLAPEARRPARPETWRTSLAGAEKTAPAPWTTPTWDGDRLSFGCLNRTCQFGTSAFPTQIVSCGRNLLARPVRLVADCGEADFAACTMVGQDGEGVDLRSEGRLGGFRVSARTRGEFDGFFWYDVELEPAEAGAALARLQLEIPLRKDASTLFEASWKDYWTVRPGHAGEFRAYAENLYETETRSMFVGDAEVGLQWTCEELADWKVRDPAKTLRLVPGERDNAIVVTFVDHRVVPDGRLRFSFGLQALPPKPLPKGWRRVRATRGGTESFEPWFPWERVHNVPDPEMKADDFVRRFKSVGEDKGRRVLWYFAGFSVSPHFPEWRTYKYPWSLTPPAVGIETEPNSHEWGYVRICPAGDGYVDYYVDSLERTVKALGIRGLYFDNQDAQFCHNFRHGHGFTGEDGRPYRTYSLRATRELAKRIYRMFKRVCPDGKIMRHMSAKNVVAVNAFADYLADGETYCRNVADDGNYRRVFTPELVQAKCMVAPFGVPRYYIPQFKRSLSCATDPAAWKKDWQAPDADVRHRGDYRHFVGYMLVHDTLVWPNFGVSMDDWFRTQDDFGFDGTERFVGYRAADNRFEQRPRVMTSYWQKPDGSWLAVTMNDTDETVRVTSKDGSDGVDVPPFDYRIRRGKR